MIKFSDIRSLEKMTAREFDLMQTGLITVCTQKSERGQSGLTNPNTHVVNMYQLICDDLRVISDLFKTVNGSINTSAVSNL